MSSQNLIEKESEKQAATLEKKKNAAQIALERKKNEAIQYVISFYIK